MTPALPKAQLGAKKVTPEELRKALAKINDSGAGEKRRMTSSFLAFAKNNGDSAALASKGEVRTDLLAKFVVHQQEAQDARQSIKSTHDISNKKSLVATLSWKNEENMVMDLGSVKAQHWMDSERGDRVSVSKERYMVEYGNPDDMEVLTNEDMFRIKTETEAEPAEENAKKFSATFAFGGGSEAASSAGEPPIANALDVLLTWTAERADPCRVAPSQRPAASRAAAASMYTEISTVLTTTGTAA